MGLTVATPAADMCDMMFSLMDFDNSGIVEEHEMQEVSVLVFKDSADAAIDTWGAMDKNHDHQITKQEYVAWFLDETAEHMQDEVIFKPEYAEHVLGRIRRLKSLKMTHKKDVFKGHQLYGDKGHSHGKVPYGHVDHLE